MDTEFADCQMPINKIFSWRNWSICWDRKIGLQEGDMILEIDGDSTGSGKTKLAEYEIKGKPDTVITL